MNNLTPNSEPNSWFSLRGKLRRLVRLVVCLACLATAASGAETSKAAAINDAVPAFGFAQVAAAAQKLAQQPYESADNAVPEHLLTLSAEQWRSFRLKPEYALWDGEGLPFVIEFIYPGFIFNRTVKLNIIMPEGVRETPFSSGMFQTDNRELAEKIDEAKGFAGVAIRPAVAEPAPEHIPSDMAGALGFMGASHFMFTGRNSAFGTYSRPAAINTALPAGEVPPYFREIWLVKPLPDSQALELFALMDSPMLTGAFRLEVVLGTSTLTKVEARLFHRQGATPPEKIGIGPLTSMFLFSEAQNGNPDDYRPEVHNADGLLLGGADGTWQWRPLANGQRLLVSPFAAGNPKGFGLLQRDNNFDHYQDLGIRFERKTSVWIEPEGDWGNGRLELVEIPATKDYHSNIMAFWVSEPAPPPAGNGEPAPPRLAYAYTVYWMPPGTSPHDLGRVKDTRIARSAQDNTVAFILDFEGGELDALEQDVGLTSVVEGPEEAPLTEKTLVKNPVNGTWRLTMRFRLPQNGVLQRLMAARDGPPALRFKAYLKKGENLPDSLTETWIYDLVP